MRQTTSIVLAVAAFALAGHRDAGAQTSPGSTMLFLDVNVGFQAPSQTLGTNATFPLFGETAVVSAVQNVPVAPVIDARIGYRATPRFSVAVAVSGRKDESDGQALAAIPSPIFVASPTIVNLTSSGLKRREIGYHIHLVWLVPVWDKVEVSVYGGPSFIHLQQTVMSGTLTGQTISVSSQNETGTAKGGNGGVDVTYLVSNRYGVGFFARYAGGSLDLPSASGVRVGGFQSGGGLRLRF